MAAIAVLLVAALLGGGLALLTAGNSAHTTHRLAGALPAAPVEVSSPGQPVTPSALANQPTTTQATTTPAVAPTAETTSTTAPTVLAHTRSPATSKPKPSVPQVVRE